MFIVCFSSDDFNLGIHAISFTFSLANIPCLLGYSLPDTSVVLINVFRDHRSLFDLTVPLGSDVEVDYSTDESSDPEPDSTVDLAEEEVEERSEN